MSNQRYQKVFKEKELKEAIGYGFLNDLIKVMWDRDGEVRLEFENDDIGRKYFIDSFTEDEVRELIEDGFIRWGNDEQIINVAVDWGKIPKHIVLYEMYEYNGYWSRTEQTTYSADGRNVLMKAKKMAQEYRQEQHDDWEIFVTEITLKNGAKREKKLFEDSSRY